jgi:D-alanyl-D-alanine dipeptidase
VERKNRDLLRDVMERHGFKNYDKEWWHFTLANEPFPDTIFDFPILPRPERK